MYKQVDIEHTLSIHRAYIGHNIEHTTISNLPS